MRPTQLLDWKIARAKPLSAPELARAFRLWDLRITYWVASRIQAERAQLQAEQDRAQACLDALIPGLDYLFSERDRLTAQGKFNPAQLAPVGSSRSLNLLMRERGCFNRAGVPASPQGR